MLGAGPGFAGLYLLGHHGRWPESLSNRLRRLAGGARPRPPCQHQLAEQDLGVLPTPSIWPFTFALGLTLAATGP